MRIGIIGYSGYIGSEIHRRFKKVGYETLLFGRSAQKDYFIDLSQIEYLKAMDFSMLDEVDYLIIAAGISSPERCETEYEMAYTVNVVGTKILINQALKHQCRIIFLSSDAVYGTDRGVFNELALTRPHTAYGCMKKDIEEAFKEVPLFKSLRLSYVVSKKDKFMDYMNQCLLNKEVMEIYHPFYRNCVMLHELMESVEWLLMNWNDYEPPCLNLCGSQLISRLSIVDERNRFLDEPILYKVINPGETFFEVRPEITEMISLYLSNIVSTVDAPFSERLKRELLIEE